MAALLGGIAAFTGRTVLAAVAAVAALIAVVWPVRRGRGQDAGLDAKAAAPANTEAPAAPSPAPAPPAETPERRPHIASVISTEPDQVLSVMLRAAQSMAPAVAAHLWLQDPPTASIRLVSAAGEMRPMAAPASFEEDWVAGVVTRGESVLCPIMAMHADDHATTLWRLAFAVPSGTAAGVACIDVVSLIRPMRPSLELLALSYQPALSAALALHVARAETQRGVRLLESARELSRRLQPDEVVAVALDAAVALSSAASASVMMPDGDDTSLRIVASRGLPPDVVSKTRVEPGEGIAGWVYSKGKPLLVEDLHPAGGSRRRGVRSAVCVPIADEDGVLGVLSAGSQDYPARFTDAHMTALEVLGRQAAVALRNAMAMSSATDLYLSTLTALAVALETKDPYALGGTRRIADLTLALGRHVGLDEDQLRALHVASLLHDVGMTIAGAPLGSTSRPLTTVERGMLKAHPVVAAQVLADLPALAEVVPLVYHHHEWYDGHGYVGGLSGEDIPLGSRLLAVADAFVAMTSDRPYRNAMPVRTALAEMEAKSGTQFDPVAVEALVAVLSEQPELARSERA